MKMKNLEKNKHAADIVATCALSCTIICSPPKSHETIPLTINISYSLVMLMITN